MNKDELIEWFWEKFNSCYLVKHDYYPERIFMFYDSQIIRQLKLAKISGEKINKTDITGICLFEQDWKNKKFYFDFNEIWVHLYYNYSTNSIEIKHFISDRLKGHSKLSELGTKVAAIQLVSTFEMIALEEYSKMKIITENGNK